MKIVALYQNKTDVLNSKVFDVIARQIRLLGINQDYENLIVNVVFVSLDSIRQINRNYRNQDKITDVLSFLLDGLMVVGSMNSYLGEIYVCLDAVQSNVSEYKREHSSDDVVCLRDVVGVIIHGILHLLGYNHNGYLKSGGVTNQIEEMFVIQEKLVEKVMTTLSVSRLTDKN